MSGNGMMGGLQRNSASISAAMPVTADMAARIAQQYLGQ
jgi:hypothetical protein